MVTHLIQVLGQRRWDWILIWHAVTCRWSIVRVAPTVVLERWARTALVRFDGYPEIQDAIGYAQAELRARRERHAYQ
jgi:hypothetical protein